MLSIYSFASFEEENLCRAWLLVNDKNPTCKNPKIWIKIHKEFTKIEGKLKIRTIKDLKFRGETVQAVVVLLDPIMVRLKHIMQI